MVVVRTGLRGLGLIPCCGWSSPSSGWHRPQVSIVVERVLRGASAASAVVPRCAALLADRAEVVRADSGRTASTSAEEQDVGRAQTFRAVGIERSVQRQNHHIAARTFVVAI
jgi:hypothetical protein